MKPLALSTLEAAMRLRNRARGIGLHPDPWKHFGPGGVEEAEAVCGEANADLAAFMRPPADVEPTSVVRAKGDPDRWGASWQISGLWPGLGPPPAEGDNGGAPRNGAHCERVWFDSPLPSGAPRNDRVELRIWRTPQTPRNGRVVLFHHPVYQNSWKPWRWFFSELVDGVAVAAMAAPYHYERTPPGWFPGEGTINPNPARVYEAIRQWFADQKAAHRVLREELGLRPVAVVGYSLGAFQSLLAAAFDELDLPIVSLACTNRYAWGLLNGNLARPVIGAMRQVGINESRLRRMVQGLELERHVHPLRDHPVLFVTGQQDRADPPPSIERLERALRPRRSLHLEAGHSTVTLYRRKVAAAIAEFFADEGVF